MRGPVILALIVFFQLLMTPAAARTEGNGPPEPKVRVGDLAPDFSLKDQDLRDVSLREFRGKKKVVLAFYVFAFTGG